MAFFRFPGRKAAKGAGQALQFADIRGQHLQKGIGKAEFENTAGNDGNAGTGKDIVTAGRSFLNIPCHRTVKSDRTIGGFGGVAEGLESKKILLELDGLMIQDKKVVCDSPIIALDKTSQTKLV